MEWQQFHFPAFLSNLHNEKDGEVWLFFNPFVGMPVIQSCIFTEQERHLYLNDKNPRYIWNTFVGKFRWEGKGNAGKA